MAKVATGDKAPDFTLPRDGGGTVSLSDFRGKWLVLFFYPKDNTPTCTTEAIDFSAKTDAFTAAGVSLLGLSPDPVKKHDKFIAKMGITLPLLSDDGGTVMQDWGAFGEKLFFGKLVQGVLRSTFLIDGAGKVAQVWKVDKVKGHAAEVLAFVQGQ